MDIQTTERKIGLHLQFPEWLMEEVRELAKERELKPAQYIRMTMVQHVTEEKARRERGENGS